VTTQPIVCLCRAGFAISPASRAARPRCGDILFANSDALLAEIRAFQDRLSTLATEIEAGDGADIELSWNWRARGTRAALRSK
jgi:hypothetical protein